MVTGVLELFLCSLMDFDGWPPPSVQPIRWSVFLLPVAVERIQPAYGVTAVLLLSYFSIPPLRSYCQTYFLPIFSVNCRISPILLRLQTFPTSLLIRCCRLFQASPKGFSFPLAYYLGSDVSVFLLFFMHGRPFGDTSLFNFFQ